MTTLNTTQGIEALVNKRSGLLRKLAVGVAALVTLAAFGAGSVEARDLAAPSSAKIVFSSDRTTGPDVVNPQGDHEIFIMNPNGTNPKQLTRNAVPDFNPTLSPNGQRVAYASEDEQSSNPQGDTEVYVVTADGSGQRNLTNNGAGVGDDAPAFSSSGKKIAYRSYGAQSSNPEGDQEVFSTNTNGSGKKNLTNTAAGVHDSDPVFSPDGQRIAFASYGAQGDNAEGDSDIYTMNADGSSPSNFTFISGGSVDDYDPVYSPDGQKIAFTTKGVQTSNPEGDYEVYVRNTTGLNEINLSNNASGVEDRSPVFSPSSQKIAFTSSGAQTSNPQGDTEVYVVDAAGSGQKNLSNNGVDVQEYSPGFSPDGKNLAFESYGKQTSNPQGDTEVYRMNASGLGQSNLTNNRAYDLSPEWSR